MSVLQVERDGSVLLLTMNRPERRNAVDRELADALSVAFDQLDDDPSLHVGILAGNGPVFCAGTDLNERLSDRDVPVSPRTDRGGEYGIVRRQRSTPLIAAVDGPAIGGGLEVVLSCDLVIAGPTATFGFPEVARGLLAACGGMFRAADRIPPAIAAEMMLTGDAIPATRAYEIGLVNGLAAEGETVTAARALAARIAKNSPDAVSNTLRALNGSRGLFEAIGWTATSYAIAQNGLSPDPLEGVTAFFEKRSPRWSR